MKESILFKLITSKNLEDKEVGYSLCANLQEISREILIQIFFEYTFRRRDVISNYFEVFMSYEGKFILSGNNFSITPRKPCL